MLSIVSELKLYLTKGVRSFGVAFAFKLVVHINDNIRVQPRAVEPDWDVDEGGPVTLEMVLRATQ